MNRTVCAGLIGTFLGLPLAGLSTIFSYGLTEAGTASAHAPLAFHNLAFALFDLRWACFAFAWGTSVAGLSRWTSQRSPSFFRYALAGGIIGGVLATLEVAALSVILEAFHVPWEQGYQTADALFLRPGWMYLAAGSAGLPVGSVIGLWSADPVGAPSVLSSPRQ